MAAEAGAQAPGCHGGMHIGRAPRRGRNRRGLAALGLALALLLGGWAWLAASLSFAQAPPPAGPAPAEQPADAAAPQGATPPAPAEAPPDTWGNALRLAGVMGLVLAVLILPFVFAWMLSTHWRMPDYYFKFALILLCVFVGVATLATGKLQRGIDLRGGVILVYEIQGATEMPGKGGPAQANAPGAEGAANVDMDKLVTALKRRVNPAGYKETVIRQFGPKQVEIIVPDTDAEQVARLERMISSVGTLEFRILANMKDHASDIEAAEKLPEGQNQLRDAEGSLLAWWVPIAAGQVDEIGPSGEVAIQPRVFLGKKRPAVLVVNDPYNVNGSYLVRADPTSDEEGKPAVGFTFNYVGGQKFGDLTGANQPDKTSGFRRRLGIILDGEMQSAPSLESTIFERGIIRGGFTNERVKELVDVLNAGSLPAVLHKEPISRMYTGPTLGLDTIQRGFWAVVISMVLVFLFMLVYYRFAGVVACLALAMNLVMLMAAMIIIGAQFTLPGLAGLALSIGMAVDSNVLIFERMREEAARGGTLRMTIRNGFGRALSAIVDSNITTLLTAAILYGIGTDQVKGFAVTLFLGLALSLFTALFCSRVVFDVAERRRWITQVRMMQLVPHTTIDFLRQKWLMIGVSTAIILVGLAATIGRGVGLLDIDFTGGVSLELVFNQKQDVATVRRKLDDLQDLVVTNVQYGEEEPGLRFVINTSNPHDMTAEDYLNQVKKVVEKRFKGKLATNVMSIEGAPKTASAEGRGGAALPGSGPLASASLSTMLLAAGAPAGPPPAAAPAQAPPAAASPPAAPPAAPATAPQPAPAPPRATAGQQPAKSGTGSPGATSQVLTFTEKISRDRLESLFTQTLAKRFTERTPNGELVPKPINLDISNDAYRQGVTAAANRWEVRIGLPPQQAMPVYQDVKQELESEPVFPSSTTIGGAVATRAQFQAIYALLFSAVMILVYVWVRFQKVSYGLGAVVSQVHDVLLALGFVAISYYLVRYLPVLPGALLIEPFKINLAMITAFLTIAGYSLNDTIVVFDRIREVRGKAPQVTAEMINRAVNETLSRSVLTGATTLIPLVVLYCSGTESIHGFCYAMLVGVITGMYSSIYIASPFLLWLARSSAASPQAALSRPPATVS